MKLFKRSSNVSAKLKQIQEAMRWHSTYDMLAIFLKLKPLLSALALHQKGPNLDLSVWTIIEESISIRNIKILLKRSVLKKL